MCWAVVGGYVAMATDRWEEVGTYTGMDAGTWASINVLSINPDVVQQLFRIWQVIFCSLVLLMHLGYALLEVGSMRSKHASSIILKHITDFSLATVSFILLGYAVTCPNFSSGPGFTTPVLAFDVSLIGVWDVDDYVYVFVNVVYASTTSAIVSLAIAERGDFRAVFAFTIWACIIVYPIPAYWVWGISDGWLYQLGFIDIAGGAVVYLNGGVAALVAAYMVGPRIGRYEGATAMHMIGHSIPLASMGFMFVWAGLFGFTCAGVTQTHLVSGRISGLGEQLGKAVLNMMVSAATAFSMYLAMSVCLRCKRLSLVAVGMAGVSACVANCCGCTVMPPWASAVLGLGVGLLNFSVPNLLTCVRIDDPVAAIAVHAGSGCLGVVAVGLFSENGAIHGNGKQLWVQIVGGLAIIAWSLCQSILFWVVVRWMGIARVSEEIELRGMDAELNCEPAYPENYALGDYLKFKQFVETHWQNEDNPENIQDGREPPIFSTDVH